MCLKEYNIPKNQTYFKPMANIQSCERTRSCFDLTDNHRMQETLNASLWGNKICLFWLIQFDSIRFQVHAGRRRLGTRYLLGQRIFSDNHLQIRSVATVLQGLSDFQSIKLKKNKHIRYLLRPDLVKIENFVYSKKTAKLWVFNVAV